MTPVAPARPPAAAAAVKSFRLTATALTAVAVAAAVWACWPTLVTFAEIWAENPQYSHGFLVPVFSAYLLWHRRERFAPHDTRGAWFGLLLLAAGCGLKLLGGYFAFAWPDRLAVVVIAGGLAAGLGGWGGLRWAWPAVAFLLFMVPLPGRVETLLSGPLQRVATAASANVLQTFGFFAQPDGTVLILSEGELGVVEACSGLRMLLAFAALSTAVAVVIRRPVWQRVAVVVAAVPIALVCNIGRIVGTGVVMETAGRRAAEVVFHDLAGWLMMPAALLLLWGLLAFCGRLFVVRPPNRPRR